MSKITNLRVVAGKYKGLKLFSPQDAITHPMGAREKLALFNMIGSYLDGARVLDAYAGSGALGIEALSWGAAAVDFVESQATAAQCIERNLEALAMRDFRHAVTSVWRMRVGEYKAQMRDEQLAYDVIIADPPYNTYPAEVLVILKPLLKSGGILALSYPARQATPIITGLEILTDRHYAAAGIAIYRKNC